MELPEKEHYTYSDYLEWDKDGRIEIIEGELIMMGAPARIHQKIVTELARQFGNFLEGKKCEVYVSPFTVRLFEKNDDNSDSVDTVVEPDLSIICDLDKLDKQGCKGAPDMIIEILSPSTMRHDRFVKFNLYQKAGVKEYWIISPEEQSVQVFLLNDNGLYVQDNVYDQNDIAKVNSLRGCFIELSKLFSEK